MSWLAQFGDHPEYQRMLKAAEDRRPVLPQWTVDQTNGTDNTDDWKQKSAMQAGFDLAMTIFKPK